VNAGGAFAELPVRAVHQQIQVPADLVMVSRVAMMMDVAATPVAAGVTRSLSAAPAAAPDAAATVSASGSEAPVVTVAPPSPQFSTTAISGDSTDVFCDHDPDLL
jgi:hypothetical protein